MSLNDELSIKNMRQRAVKSSFTLLVRQFVMRVLGFFGLIFLARLLSPEIFGVFAVLQFIVLFFERVASMGLPPALIRQRNPVSETQLRVVFTVQAVVLIVSSSLIIIYSPLIISHYAFNKEIQLAIYFMIASLFFSALKTIPIIKLERLLYHDKVAIVEIIEYLVYLGVAIFLSMQGAEIWALIIAAILRSIVSAMLLYYFSAWRPAFSFDFKVLKPLLHIALPMQLMSWIDLANRSMIPVLAGFLGGVQTVGILNFSKTLLDVLIFQPINLMGKVQLRVFGRIQDDVHSVGRNLGRMYVTGSAIAFLPLCILVVFSEPIILILVGEKWVSAAPTISLMCIGYAFYSILLPSVKCLQGIGDAWTPLFFSAARVLAMIAFIYVGFSYFGELGFALAIAIVVPISSIWLYFIVKEKVRAKGLFKFSIICMVSIVAGTVAFIVDKILYIETSIIALILSITVCFLVYVLLLCLFIGSDLADTIKLLTKNIKMPMAIITILNKTELLLARVSIFSKTK